MAREVPGAKGVNVTKDTVNTNVEDYESLK